MDVSSQKGRLLVYIKSSLPFKMLTKLKLHNNISIILSQFNMRKKSGCLLVFINCNCKTINISSIF